MKKRKPLIVYQLIAQLSFIFSVTWVYGFDAEAISKVSKAIAESKIMNDVKQIKENIYEENLLENKTVISTFAPKIGTVYGLKSFSQDQVDPIIWHNSDTYLRNIPIIETNLDNPGKYDTLKNKIMIDYSKMANPKFSKIYTPRGPDPDTVLAHELGHAQFEQLFRPVRRNYSPNVYKAAHENFANYREAQFNIGRQNRFAVESNIARDLKYNGYNAKIYNSYNQYRLDQSRWNYIKPPKIGN